MVKNPEITKKSIKLMLSQSKDFIGFIVSNIFAVIGKVAILVLIKRFVEEIKFNYTNNLDIG